MAIENVVQLPGTQRVTTQHDNGGGGSGGDGVVARIARVESDVKNINGTVVRMWDDIRDLRTDIGKLHKTIDDNFKWMIGGFAAMAVTTVCTVAWFYDAFKDILLPLINK